MKAISKNVWPDGEKITASQAALRYAAPKPITILPSRALLEVNFCFVGEESHHYRIQYFGPSTNPVMDVGTWAVFDLVKEGIEP